MPFNWLNQRFRNRSDSRADSLGLAEAMARWRLVKLAETLKWAVENSPHYRQSIAPESLCNILADLAAGRAGQALEALPFTFSAQVAADSLSFLAVPQDEVEGIVSVPTSGTSGQAKRIFSSAADLEETVAFFEYGMRFLVGPSKPGQAKGGDRVALAMSPARPGNVGDLLGRGLARWNIPYLAHGFVPQNVTDEKRWLAELADWRPTCLVGVPPQMLAISRHRLAGRLSHLKTMLLSGDVAEDRLVRELEKNLPGCRVFRHYGLTECGLGGAVECRQRAWPHLRDDLWVEIIDEEGRSLPPGQTGEITVTTLSRRAMPFLRYRTGDEGLLLAAPCPCGALRPRIKTLGRLSDRFSLPGGLCLAVSDFEEPLLACPYVRDFDLRLTRAGALEIILALRADAPAGAVEEALASVKSWLGQKAEAIDLKGSVMAENSPSRPSGGKRRLARE